MLRRIAFLAPAPRPSIQPRGGFHRVPQSRRRSAPILRLTTSCSLSQKAQETNRDHAEQDPETEEEGGTIFVPDEETEAPNFRDGVLYDDNNRFVFKVGARCQSLPRPDKGMFKAKFRTKLMHTSRDVKECPLPQGVPEIAIVGRSNVGKSSLLKMLTAANADPPISSKPGTTQTINHYFVDNKWWLVDLPGYGYAEATAEERKEWDKFSYDYLTSRKSESNFKENVLAGVLMLVDGTLPPQQVDMDYCDFLISESIPFVIIYTKCDRETKQSAKLTGDNRNFLEYLQNRWKRLPSMICTSALTGEGREEVLQFVSSFIAFKRVIAREEQRVSRKYRLRDRRAAEHERKFVVNEQRRKQELAERRESDDPEAMIGVGFIGARKSKSTKYSSPLDDGDFEEEEELLRQIRNRK